MYRAGFFISILLFNASAIDAEEVVPGKATAVELKTTRDQASYAIGLNLGRGIKRDGLELNATSLVQGLMDGINAAQPKLTDEQCRAALQALDRELEQALAAQGEKNKKDGQAFLAANKKKPGVVTLPSGLQYTVLKSGKGPTPAAQDTVKAHYHGTLIDGRVFDSSVERGEPEVMSAGGAMRGWTEALLKMKVGDKWRLVIPPELGLGPQGQPPVIGPHAVLVLEVELLAIEPKQ